MTWPPDPGAVGKRVDEMDTPCLLLDLDQVERNLDRMAALFADRRVRVRPHAKTHKVPNVALMQLARGAIGVCCAKLGEAEVMAAGGVSGLLITTEIVGVPKIRRLLGVARRTERGRTAGTGTCVFAAAWPHVPEVQPGSYVVMDSDYGQVQGLGFGNALTVLTTVLSKRGNDVIVDAGHKALSGDAGPARPKDLDATYTTGGDEHGKLTFANGNPLAIGDTVEMLPSHCDTTINLYDVYHVTRGGRVVAVWPIAARGRVQ